MLNLVHRAMLPSLRSSPRAQKFGSSEATINATIAPSQLNFWICGEPIGPDDAGPWRLSTPGLGESFMQGKHTFKV